MLSPRTYHRRVVDIELDELLAGLPAVALEGPKAVGKTATAERRVRRTVRLDIPGQATTAAADPDLVVQGAGPLLLDEWQHVPTVWDAVRRRVDEGAAPGSFLLAGSAQPDPPPMHSGAGRIVSVRMRPLSLAERDLIAPTVSLGGLLRGERGPLGGESPVTLADYAREIVQSGFPGIRQLTGRVHRAQMDAYLTHALERESAAQGIRERQRAVLRSWLTVYAAATGTVTSLETVRSAASLAAVGERQQLTKLMALSYHEALQRMWLLDPLPGWVPTRNLISRLSQAPRLHLADPALAVRLLGVDERALLEGRESPLHGTPTPSRSSPRFGPLLGQLFESLVTLSVRVYAQACEARVAHCRVHGGAREVDLIVERADHRVVALEVKLTSAVGDAEVQHLRWLKERLGDDLLNAVVITSGSHAYRRPDGIAVVPAALLGP